MTEIFPLSLLQKMCVNLYCEKPDGYCSSNDEPAADGTSCGPKKVKTYSVHYYCSQRVTGKEGL